MDRREELLWWFLHRDYERVVGVVALLCQSREAAEDAVQDALVKAWTRRDDPDSFTAWITVLALNSARSSWRRTLSEQRAFGRVCPDRYLPDPPVADSISQRYDVTRALQVLSTRQRQVVVLHYWLDLSVAQIASVLSVSPGTVKQQLFRARAALAGPLADTTYTSGR